MTASEQRVLEIEPLASPPFASIRLPGSKSITNRALVCAALAGGVTELRGALFADDTVAMMQCLAALGYGIEPDESNNTIRVGGHGRHRDSGEPVTLDANMSGTTSRFMLPVAALHNRPIVVDGHDQLRQRPFDDLTAALRSLGVTVERLSCNGSLPVRVTGPIRRSEVEISTERSSQYLSGLMLAAPLVPGGLTIRLAGNTVSRPYIEMTRKVMAAFGVTVTMSPTQVVIPGGGYNSPGRYEIEPDASAATYFWAAAAITGGTVHTEGIGSSSMQADARFVDVLESMGAMVDSRHTHTTVSGVSLQGVEADLSDLSDSAPSLAVAAAMAQGTTTVTGIGFIREKESDRIAGPVTELRRCGVAATELADGFEISPINKPTGARIRTYEDHRIAMAFSVLGLAVEGIRIEDPNCVNKTFPGFFETLEQLRDNVRVA